MGQGQILEGDDFSPVFLGKTEIGLGATHGLFPFDFLRLPQPLPDIAGPTVEHDIPFTVEDVVLVRNAVWLMRVAEPVQCLL